MKTATISETVSGFETSFVSSRGTTVLGDEPVISRSRLGFESLQSERLGSQRRNSFFQPQDDVMEDLEWRMGL
ncbi:MAG: hypothetical protein HY043_05085 [Verrucomicrobia bacterium]|nr:hypothetical protein [Verrucomicrobiota bacterium]